MPLPSQEAKKLIRRLLEEGLFVVVKHAREEMTKDDLCDTDAVNVLRAGVVREAEFENGCWRYHVTTPKMTFVVEFDPEPECSKAEQVESVADLELVVVTAWRTNR